MPSVRKNLGQAKPAAEVLTDLYQVPALTQTTVSTLHICNQGAAPVAFRVAHAVAGAADTVAQYLYYDEIVPGGKTFTITTGITLAASDVLRVESATPDLSFNLYGEETT